MEEIKAPDIQRPPENNRPRKTKGGATVPLSSKELRRAPDEGSFSSRGAEARELRDFVCLFVFTFLKGESDV